MVGTGCSLPNTVVQPEDATTFIPTSWDILARITLQRISLQNASQLVRPFEYYASQNLANINGSIWMDWLQEPGFLRMEPRRFHVSSYHRKRITQLIMKNTQRDSYTTVLFSTVRFCLHFTKLVSPACAPLPKSPESWPSRAIIDMPAPPECFGA